MKATTWFATQSFNAGTEPEAKTVTVGEYANVPADHHVHYCVTCDKDYPCTEPHFRTTETGRVRDTPPRATKNCRQCRSHHGTDSEDSMRRNISSARYAARYAALEKEARWIGDSYGNQTYFAVVMERIHDGVIYSVKDANGAVIGSVIGSRAECFDRKQVSVEF